MSSNVGPIYLKSVFESYTYKAIFPPNAQEQYYYVLECNQNNIPIQIAGVGFNH